MGYVALYLSCSQRVIIWGNYQLVTGVLFSGNVYVFCRSGVSVNRAASLRQLFRVYHLSLYYMRLSPREKKFTYGSLGLLYWHYSYSMRSRIIGNGRASVLVCLSVPSFDRSRGGFADERCADRRYWSIAAAAERPAAATSQHKAAARRSAANASSVTSTADVGSWTQTCSQFHNSTLHVCFLLSFDCVFDS